MITEKNIAIKSVDKTNWADFETLFQSKGGPSYCWCMVWRMTKYAQKNGAKYVEAYPVEPDSPSYRFMGFVKTFEKAGFHIVKKAGTRRHVMTYQL